MDPNKTAHIKVVHITAECYPAAKVGGLGDVLGSLPKYQVKSGIDIHVVMPKYSLPWFFEQNFEEVYGNHYWIPNETIHYRVEKLVDEQFGFHLYVIDIPGKFDRRGVYGDEFGYFGDETERWLAFQRCALDWVSNWDDKPQILHCHDHHTGLIPFMAKFCYQYSRLQSARTVFTIHNERYQGVFGWNKQYLIPRFDTWKSGMLDWSNHINPFASAIKCADIITTVSQAYMDELKSYAFGLEWLFRHESHKTIGILNGIDVEVWNPKKDPTLDTVLKRSERKFKTENKHSLCEAAGLDPNVMAIGFIGRMVYQKGADILARSMLHLLQNGKEISFLILGTGDKNVESAFFQLGKMFPDRVAVSLNYDEAMAHRIYAGTDFLIMPSRSEPCGLNQMYAMRYGSIPVVHNTGGLKDSVIAHTEENGTGIKFYQLNEYELSMAILTAKEVYNNQEVFEGIRSRAMKQDFSWDKSAKIYKAIYEELI